MFYLHEFRPSDKGRGPGHPDPEIRGGGGEVSKKKFFSALRASVWSKLRRGAGPPGLSPGSAIGMTDHFQINDFPSRLALEQRPGAIRKRPIN